MRREENIIVAFSRWSISNLLRGDVRGLRRLLASEVASGTECLHLGSGADGSSSLFVLHTRGRPTISGKDRLTVQQLSRNYLFSHDANPSTKHRVGADGKFIGGTHLEIHTGMSYVICI